MSFANLEKAVQERYARSAQEHAADLCCSVEYASEYLKLIPEEVLERDYGCGDPSRHVGAGETVLDLGSGTGKICFIAAQVVGPHGRVIGVDMTPEMLAVARRNAPVLAQRLGYSNVEFRRGRIQDLALDLERFDEELAKQPIASAQDFFAAQALADRLRVAQPLVGDQTIDVVVSNCVLNLVEPGAKGRLFQEIFRVLRAGGRAVISDIAADEEVPEDLQKDAALWSGCVAGAMTEEGFLHGFESAGFYGVRILARQAEPWRVVEGIEFRSLTVEAFRGDDKTGRDRGQAAIYKGPFRAVADERGHRFARGQRTAIDDVTFAALDGEPYRSHFEFIEPLIEVDRGAAPPFDRTRPAVRHPRETKGVDQAVTTAVQGACCVPPKSA